MRHDAGEIARLLAARVQSLCLELLPDGRKEGAEWVCGSISTRRGFSVRLTGGKAGVWSNFGGGGEGGDALDLVAFVRFSGDRRAALAWSRQWLGLDHTGATPHSTPPAAPPRVVDDAGEMARRGAARRLFLAAQPGLRGTPAAAYLTGRGIDLAELARQPGALRFHPALWCSETKSEIPAMVAAITDPQRGHVATHRTYLAKSADGRWTKAPLKAPKTTLGSYAGGVIPLWRGRSGKPLRQAGADEVVVITEGIENALSIAIARPDLRVLASVSLANLGRILLPPALIDVIIAADNDAPGSAAAAGLQRAVDRLLAEGRSVRIARAPAEHKDMNDALRGHAA
jgi:hypothetical protein